MKVDHLYVLSMITALDHTEGDRRLETLRTAKALYTRHGAKAKTAANYEITMKSEAKLLDSRGDTESKQALAPTSTGEGKQEVVSSKATAGLYLVFHSDGGGMALIPKKVAETVAAVVPGELHTSITKISLFACNVADQGEGSHGIDSVIGKPIEKVPKLVGGLQIMVSLLGDLKELGIRPMICGYDIAVFAGEGPYQHGKPAREIKQKVNGEWVSTGYSSEDVYGRKLVIKPGRQSLVPLKSMDNKYKNLHKKVLRLNDEGKIAEALAGWSGND